MNVLLIFLGLLPSFIWLGFFLQEDIHPEPKRTIFPLFLVGMFSALLAAGIQYLLQLEFPDNFANLKTFGPIFGFAAVEEILKFFPVFLIMRKSKFFDEPIDAMIYMITAASGMAAIENIGIMFGNQILDERIGLLVFRFLGATLLHVLSSGLVGYYWAKGIIKKKVFIFSVFGLILATALHAIFNYSIIVFSGIFIYPIIILIFAAFFIFNDFEILKKNDNIKIN